MSSCRSWLITMMNNIGRRLLSCGVPLVSWLPLHFFLENVKFRFGWLVCHLATFRSCLGSLVVPLIPVKPLWTLDRRLFRGLGRIHAINLIWHYCFFLSLLHFTCCFNICIICHMCAYHSGWIYHGRHIIYIVCICMAMKSGIWPKPMTIYSNELCARWNAKFGG